MSLPPREKLFGAIQRALDHRGNRRFRQTVEMIVVLKGVDPKSQAGRIREVVFLPRGRGKDLDVCVVASGDMAEKGKSAGAKRVITPEELQGLSKKAARRIAEECDWILVRTDLMSTFGRALGPALGPRGKAPVPLAPTADVAGMIARYKNAVVVRAKEQLHVSVPIGTEGMSVEDLAENAASVLNTLVAKLPEGMNNVDRIMFKTTMGVPVEV
ncbi:MAG: 50S ribosomal protein L1 [Desulfurococcaceae archaeon]